MEVIIEIVEITIEIIIEIGERRGLAAAGEVGCSEVGERRGLAAAGEVGCSEVG